MPTLDTVERFIAKVESGDTVAAIEAFYAPAATMRENQQAPRVGIETLMAHEREAVRSVPSARMAAIRPVFVAGDHVVIRWRIEFERRSGSRVVMEELAYQRWAGEQIAEEQFFYDPVQLKAPAP